MANGNSKASWLRRPQQIRFRRIVFRVHLWSEVVLGLYIFFISVTGSVLVYRNELYVMATPDAIASSDAQVLPSAVEAGRVSVGIWMVSTLIELHADLLGGSTARKVNGIGAFAVLFSSVTGLIIW